MVSSSQINTCECKFSKEILKITVDTSVNTRAPSLLPSSCSLNPYPHSSRRALSPPCVVDFEVKACRGATVAPTVGCLPRGHTQNGRRVADAHALCCYHLAYEHDLPAAHQDHPSSRGFATRTTLTLGWPSAFKPYIIYMSCPFEPYITLVRLIA